MEMLENQKIEKIAALITVGLSESKGKGWSLIEAATACIFWCLLHNAFKNETKFKDKSKAIKQLQNGPLSKRSEKSISLKLGNITSVAQNLISQGLPIYFRDLYEKDQSPIVCQGHTPRDNYQRCLEDILPRALKHFDLYEGMFIDPAHDEVHEGTHSEGQKVKYLGTRYERDHKARKACLDYWGYSCQVCDMKFSDVYGEIGDQFIHVHHLNPISETGNTITDPVSDLRPVCPNCHSMLHKKHPPYGIEELKELMKLS